jgi:hypothetical protein
LRLAVHLDGAAESSPTLGQLVRIDAAQAAHGTLLGEAPPLVIGAAPAGLLPVAATDGEVVCVPSEE